MPAARLNSISPHEAKIPKLKLNQRRFVNFLRGFVIVFTLTSATAQATMQSLNFDEFLRRQEETSVRHLFANISPSDGSKGAVIASPSRHDPDYYFHWVRDAGLVMDVVTTMYQEARGEERAKLFVVLNDFVEFSRRNQQIQTMTGLGEPKFYVDGRPFNGPWGRPQNDSPAVRALAMIRWAKILLAEGRRAYVQEKLYAAAMPPASLIKTDLEYVSHQWRERCFDLWEEFVGHHFYTRMVQRAALEEGAELAAAMQDPHAAAWYRWQAAELGRALEQHWDARAKRIRVTLDRRGDDYKNSGLDASVLLAVLHTKRMTGPFSIMDDRVLQTALQLETDANQRYDINKRGLPATMVGRYPEDRYYGGNPWVLTTAAYAEMYYRLANVLVTKSGGKSPHFNKGMNEFLKSVVGTDATIRALRDAKNGRLNDKSRAVIATELRAKGDEYMKRIQYHTPSEGNLAEQVHRDHGHMGSARDLTWSYASFLTAVWNRH